jgi:hypothetical protein
LLTAFLNVDVDLRCERGIDELLGHLEPFVLVLHRTAEEASLELNEAHASLEEAILNVATRVEALPAEARRSWDACDWRRINIGIQAGHAAHEACFQMSNAALARVAGLSFDVVFTVYAPIGDRSPSS